MRGAAIVRPLPFVIASSAGLNAPARLLTAEPKEVAVATGGAAAVTLDLGSAQAVDTIFIGFANGAGPGAVQLSYGLAGAGEAALAPAPLLSTKLFAPRRHFGLSLEAPVTARFIGISAVLPAGFELGVLAVGKAFAPASGHEPGCGRQIVGTGSVARRPDGGFGIDAGSRAGGFAWTYSGLSDTDRDDLYAIVLDRWLDRPVLVIEESGTASAAEAERWHWGLLTRIEQYERKAAEGETVWPLRMEDWV